MNALRSLAKQSGDDQGQKGFNGVGEALAEGLFGVSRVGGQGDDAGEELQREVGLGSQRQQAHEEIAHRDFARRTLQKTGLAGEGFRVEVLEFGEDGGEWLLEGIEEGGRILHGG